MIASNNRIWIAGTVLIAIAVVALGWLLGISPKLSEASASAQQAVQVLENNQAQTIKLSQLKADFANLPTVKAELEQLQGQIPSNSDYPAFLSELNNLASSETVTVTNVTFAAPTLLTSVPAAGAAGATATASPTATPTPDPSATAAATTPAASAGAAAGSVVTIPTTLTLSGSFSHLLSAIGSLQTGSRLLLVSGISTASTKGTDGGSTDTYSATVTGLLYVLTDSQTLIESAPTSTTTTAPTATDTATANPTDSANPTGTSTP